jgi:NAD(P)-dependent dehydrogenase (short-subunit alcohol dehydrogenase family)
VSPGWTAADIPDQHGHRAVVTGANSGIGYHAALELARHGAEVTLACRDEARGQAALEKLRAEVPGANAELRLLDLADLASVRAFATELPADPDVLVNNAGVMAVPHRTTADGFEMHIGTNHLGHFALTGLLLPALLRRPAPRVVTLSSTMHRTGRIAFDDLQGERHYRRWAAYSQSKLANLLFAFELQRRAEDAGAPLTSVAAHPGYAATNLQSAKLEDGVVGWLEAQAMRVGNLLFAQSDAAGALPTLYAATMDIPGGAYVGPDGPGGGRGHPHLVGASGAATDLEAARRLWDVSESLTGVRYPF